MFELPTIAMLIVGLYLISSIKILAEYERGVIFRLGRLLSQPKGPGVILVFAPIDRIVRISMRSRYDRSPAAGCSHAGQRHGEGERGYFLSRDRSEAGGGRSQQFPVRHFAACANHAPERFGRSRARRVAERSRKTESSFAGHSGPAHGGVGREGFDGRGEAGGIWPSR